MKWNGIKGFENTDAKSDWVHDEKNVGYMLQEKLDIYQHLQFQSYGTL